MSNHDSIFNFFRLIIQSECFCNSSVDQIDTTIKCVPYSTRRARINFQNKQLPPSIITSLHIHQTITTKQFSNLSGQFNGLIFEFQLLIATALFTTDTRTSDLPML